jgi:cytoskeletal protein CcmA (bactofilin family)
MELVKDDLEKEFEPGRSANLRASFSTQNVQPPSRAVDDMLPNQAGIAPSRDRAYLDQGCRINGKLKFSGPVRIDGQVEGEIDAHDTSVAIGRTAVVTAKIKAVSVTVAGVVNGEISASQRIELQASAKVSGSLAAPKLVVLEGAVFEGNCTMPRKAARDERPAEGSRKDERPMTETNGKERVGQI